MRSFYKSVLIFLFCIALQIMRVQTLCAHEAGDVKFMPNQGQWTGDFHYKARTRFGDMYVESKGFSLQLVNPALVEHAHEVAHESPNIKERGQAIKFSFVGATGGKTTKTMHESGEYYNFFLGNKKHVSKLKAYGQVKVEEIYPGIDAEYLEQDGHLKYQFFLQNPADISKIRIKISGANGLSIKENVLQINTLFGTIEETGLVAYQEVKGEKKFIACQYRLNGNEVTYKLGGKPISNVPLVIDPILMFSTFSGSTADNWGFTATYGESGTGFVGGIVFATGFPVTPGVWDDTYNGINTGNDVGGFDIGILKFSSDGRQLLYATYLGGREADTPHSLVVDNDDNLVIFGATGSANFPLHATALQTTFRGGTFIEPLGTSSLFFRNGCDMFVTKLSPDGTQLVGSTFFGGTSNDGVMPRPAVGSSLVANYGDQFRGDVTVDAQNRIYIVSTTNSADFPLQNPIQNALRGALDGVVACFEPDLSSTVWSTYLGGNNLDAVYSIQIDNANRIVVTGGTTSTNFFTSADAINSNSFGLRDAFVSVINPAGSAILHSTYLGTPQNDQGFLVQVDSLNNVYVFGQSQGDMPVSAGVYSVANGRQFIYKMNPTLSQTEFSTVFGNLSGNINISPTAFLVDRCNQIYISGWGGTTNAGFAGGNTLNMPTTSDAYQSTTDGSDFYLMVLEANARSLKYATFFGGSVLQEHVDGGTSRFDPSGIVYHAVCAGCGGRSDFPTTPGAWSRTNRSTNCNSAIFKFDFSFLRAEFQTTADSGCAPLTVNFNNESRNGTNYVWEFQDGTVLDTLATTVNHTFTEPGEYNVILRATNNSTCPNQSIAQRIIKVFASPAIGDSIFRFCTFSDTLNVQLGGNFIAGSSYQWSPPNFLSNPAVANPQIIGADSAITYRLISTTIRGCRDTANLQLNNGLLALDLSTPDSTGCAPYSVRLYQQNIQANQLLWIFGNDTLATAGDRDSLLLNLIVPGNYTIRVVALNAASCLNQVVDSLSFSSILSPVLADTTLYFCSPNDTLNVLLRTSFTAGANFAWEPPLFLNSDTLASPSIVRPDSSLVYTVRATLPLGCADTAIVRIVNREFKLSLLADTLKGCIPFPVDFRAVVSPLPGSLFFIAGNDTIARNQAPFEFSRDYTQAADYLVRLVARSDTSCQAELRDSLVVLARNIPEPRVFSNQYCTGDTLVLNAHFVDEGNSYSWTPMPSFSSDSLAVASYQGGLFDTISVAISSAFGCNTNTSFNLNPIRLFAAFSVAQAYDSCADERSATFFNQTPSGPSFSWSFGNGLISAEISPSTEYSANGNFIVRMQAQQENCVETVEQQVVFNNQPVAFEPNFDFVKTVTGCNESPSIKLTNQSSNIDSSFWDFGDGRLSKMFEPEVVYGNEGTYTVGLRVQRGACFKTLSKGVYSKKLLVPNVVTSLADGKNDSYELVDIGPGWKVNVYNRHGKGVFETDNYENNWPAEDVQPGTYFIKVQSPFNKGCNHWLEVLGK